jgi:hypothetical protein
MIDGLLELFENPPLELQAQFHVVSLLSNLNDSRNLRSPNSRLGTNWEQLLPNTVLHDDVN